MKEGPPPDSPHRLGEAAPLRPAGELDQALPLRAVKSRTLGIAEEQDTALALAATVTAGTVAVAQSFWGVPSAVNEIIRIGADGVVGYVTQAGLEDVLPEPAMSSFWVTLGLTAMFWAATKYGGERLPDYDPTKP